MSSKRCFGDMTGVTCTRQEHEGLHMFCSGKACHQRAGRFGRGRQAFTINVMNAAINVKHLLPVWEQFRAATDITTIRDEAHCARMTEMLQALHIGVESGFELQDIAHGRRCLGGQSGIQKNSCHMYRATNNFLLIFF